jgi:hypothetical protein
MDVSMVEEMGDFNGERGGYRRADLETTIWITNYSMGISDVAA